MISVSDYITSMRLTSNVDKAGDLFALLNPISHVCTPEQAERYKVEPMLSLPMPIRFCLTLVMTRPWSAMAVASMLPKDASESHRTA